MKNLFRRYIDAEINYIIQGMKPVEMADYALLRYPDESSKNGYAAKYYLQTMKINVARRELEQEHLIDSNNKKDDTCLILKN